MSLAIEELDVSNTALGELVLRRRRYPVTGDLDIYEVILNDEFLMSSLFTAGEIALANLAIAGCDVGAPTVLVGGLGLGFTARTVLEHGHVRALTVVEWLPPVIEWQRQALLPGSQRLTRDPRCRIEHGDFFALVERGFDAENFNPPYDVIALDIDHAPDHTLAAAHASFYTVEGLSRLCNALSEKGCFALWSNDLPDAAFSERLDAVFSQTTATVVENTNPFGSARSTNTIYVAQR